MSECKLITFVDGVPSDSYEFRNSWGGAARIWDAMFQKYLKDPNNPYDSWMAHSDDLWKLANRDSIPRCERAVHASTFDYAIVRRENFEQYGADLRAFVERYPTGQRVCHLLAWSDIVRECQAEAIGFHATSCGESLWSSWDGESDEVLYDLRTGDKHFEVYDEMDKEPQS